MPMPNRRSARRGLPDFSPHPYPDPQRLRELRARSQPRMHYNESSLPIPIVAPISRLPPGHSMPRAYWYEIIFLPLQIFIERGLFGKPLTPFYDRTLGIANSTAVGTPSHSQATLLKFDGLVIPCFVQRG